MHFSEQEVVSVLNAQRESGQSVELPRTFTEYAVFVDLLRDCGVLDWLQSEVLGRRAGSYELVDVVLFFSAMFTSAARDTSIGDFAEQSAEYGHELAAIGGRNRWMTQSTVSRALAAVTRESAVLVADKLLAAITDRVQRSELCLKSGYRDGAGARITVLHWDGTVEATRQRALPESDGLPAAIRLSDSLSEPGYSGRKRGEVIFSRSIASDATTGAWLHVDLCAGNGSPGDQLAAAVVAAIAFAAAGPEQPCVVVCDGVSGGLPQSRAVLAGGLHILTRCSDYDRLKTPAASNVFATTGWLPVEDSMSGPKREAIDLGSCQIAGKKVRVIASRFRTKAGKQRGVGHTVGGWRYELFYCDLPVSGWAANDLVTLYYGRTAIENRFMAEDRELNLSRVFSFEGAGQLLACSIGMAIWGLRLLTGISAVPDAVPQRPSRPRPPRPEPEAPVAGENDEEISEGGNEEVVETSATALPLPVVVEWCADRPGWSPKGALLECPANVLLVPTYRRQDGVDRVRFRAPQSTCGTCARITSCTLNPSSTYRKEVSLALSERAPKVDRSTDPPVRQFDTVSEQPDSPPALPDAPILVSSVLRKRGKAVARACVVDVTACLLEPPVPVDDEHFASDPESKQRRRKSIEMRVAANARVGEAAASVTLRAPPEPAAVYRRLKSLARSA